MLFVTPVEEQGRQRIFVRADIDRLTYVAIEVGYLCDDQDPIAIIPVPGVDIEILGFPYPLFFAHLARGFSGTPPIDLLKFEGQYERNMQRPDTTLYWNRSQMENDETRDALERLGIETPFIVATLPAGRWVHFPIAYRYRRLEDSIIVPSRSNEEISQTIHVQSIKTEDGQLFWEKSGFEMACNIQLKFASGVVDPNFYAHRHRGMFSNDIVLQEKIDVHDD